MIHIPEQNTDESIADNIEIELYNSVIAYFIF